MNKKSLNNKLKNNAIVPDYLTFKQRAENQKNLFGIQNNFNTPFPDNKSANIENIQIRTHIIQK